jgi:hypothetical protein
MMRLPGFQMVILLLAAWVAAGYTLESPACHKQRTGQGVRKMKSEERVWGRAVENCRLSASLPTPKFDAGQPVELALVFKNEGPTLIKFPRSSLWFDYQYVVRDESDAEVPLTEFGKQQWRSAQMGGAVAVFEIAPGKEYLREFELSRLYELSRPGKYKVEASKELPHPSGQGFFKVVSNTVEFEITTGQQNAPPR